MKPRPRRFPTPSSPFFPDRLDHVIDLEKNDNQLGIELLARLLLDIEQNAILFPGVFVSPLEYERIIDVRQGDDPRGKGNGRALFPRPEWNILFVDVRDDARIARAVPLLVVVETHLVRKRVPLRCRML